MGMADRATIAFSLDCIADQIAAWLKWHTEHRGRERLTTDEDTAIMGLPVPHWPTHGQFEIWIKTMREAAQELHPIDRN